MNIHCYSSEKMNDLAVWRNAERANGESFARYVRNTIAVEVGMTLLTVAAVIETAVYAIFTSLSVLAYAFTARPLNHFVQVLQSSAFTIAWGLMNILQHPFPTILYTLPRPHLPPAPPAPPTPPASPTRNNLPPRNDPPRDDNNNNNNLPPVNNQAQSVPLHERWAMDPLDGIRIHQPAPQVQVARQNSLPNELPWWQQPIHQGAEPPANTDPVSPSPQVPLTPQEVLAPFALAEPTAEIIGSVTVNRNNFHLGPKPIDLRELRANVAHADPGISWSELGGYELLEQFDQIFKNMRDNDVFCREHGTRWTKREARQKIKAQFCDQTVIVPSDRDDPFDTPDDRKRKNYNRMRKSEMELFLKSVVLEIRKDDIPHEKKIDAFERLAEAANHCPPRKHAESLRVYRILTNQIDTAEQFFFQYLQNVKEDLFEAHYFLSSEPVQTLNYIRRAVGAQLGLDISDVNLQDTYIDSHNRADVRNPITRQIERHTRPAQFLAVFNEFYTPKNILTLMKTYLNKRMFQDPDVKVQISQYINDEVTKLVDISQYGPVEVARLSRLSAKQVEEELNQRAADSNDQSEIIKDYRLDKQYNLNHVRSIITAYATLDDATKNLLRTNPLSKDYKDHLPLPYQNNDDSLSDKNKYLLTDEGVRFLCVHFGILNPTKPHGHLVVADVAEEE